MPIKNLKHAGTSQNVVSQMSRTLTFFKRGGGVYTDSHKMHSMYFFRLPPGGTSKMQVMYFRHSCKQLTITIKISTLIYMAEQSKIIMDRSNVSQHELQSATVEHVLHKHFDIVF